MAASMPSRRLLVCLVLSLVAGLAFGCSASRPPPVVSIVKGDQVDKMVAEALELIGGLKGLVKDGDTVVIKPNLVTPDKAKAPGLMTDVRVVAALVKEIQRAAKCRIIVAEGAAPEHGRETTDGFKANGYTEMAEKLGVALLDINKDRKTMVQVAGQGYADYVYPETVRKCNVLVDVPVLKTHNITGVTLGIKNLFGLMPPPRMRFHEKLHEVLCDLVQIRPPDLVLVDGLVGTEGQGPLRGTPIRMDLVLAGRNVVAVDSVAAAVMGYDPAKIRIIAMADKAGLGESDLAKITVKGQPIDQVRRLFAYAKWEAAVAIERTDEAVKKILALADESRDLHDWDEGDKVVGHRVTFKPERLKPDTKKHPQRTSYGFKAFMFHEDKEIWFVAPYETVLPENAQAAVEEMTRWIEENLGVKVKPGGGPKPADW
jgi:uncharacterized protein (DUF362 family)